MKHRFLRQRYSLYTNMIKFLWEFRSPFISYHYSFFSYFITELRYVTLRYVTLRYSILLCICKLGYTILSCENVGFCLWYWSFIISFEFSAVAVTSWMASSVLCCM